MNKLFICFILLSAVNAIHAQESPASVPPVKNVLNVKTSKLPQQPVKISKDSLALLTQDNIMLTSHSWNLIRWWITSGAGHSVSDPSFKFKSGGIISCNLFISEAGSYIQAGSYTVRGNNINIVLKKDANVIMNCSLTYNSTNQIMTGTYVLQVLPIANPPANYRTGTVTGDMKLTRN